MTERERLIELIHKSEILCDTCGENSNSYCAEYLADYLIANGVIVPPCKVGDVVYRIVRMYGDKTPIIVEGDIFEITSTNENGKIKNRFYFWEKDANKIINRDSLWCDFADFGKTVFLTKEEAEKALKEREGK